jgi:putative ABC transport system permease protein
MDHLLRDLRYGIRSLAKAPAFTLAVVLVLALGIGATLAVFGVLNAVLLRPLPYVQPERVVQVFETFPLAGGSEGSGSVSYPNFRDWRERSRSFEELAVAGWPADLTLQGAGEPERVSSAAVGASLFRVLGTPPLLGRTFGPGEDEPGAAPVAVLGEDLWRSRFGADPGILGRTVTLDGTAYTVVGVMPAAFQFPPGTSRSGLWIPLQPGPQLAESRGSHAFLVVGRLRPGVSPEAAEREMKQIAAAIEAEHPGQEGRSALVRPVHEVAVGQVRPTLLLIMGAAGLVLLIACGNVAGMLLARSTEQRREVAIRAALGAGRARVALQFFVQSLLLVVAGAGAGLLLAVAALRGVALLASDMLPRSAEIGLDARVAAFLLLVSALTAVLFGLVPALQTSRLDLQRTLREGGRQGSGGPGGQAMRSLLVVAQVSLSLVLLVGAGLLLRTFASLLAADTGVRAESVLTMRLGYGADTPDTPPGEAVRLHFEPVLERIRSLPGVRNAGLISHLPLQSHGFNGNFGIEGNEYDSVRDMPFAELRVVSPGYFAAMGVPVLQGRDVSRHDVEGAPPVVWINRALADRYFPDLDPVGERLTQLGPEPLTIAGVVGDVRQVRLDRRPSPEVYGPYPQWAGMMGGAMSVVVGTEVPPATMAGPVRDAIRVVHPGEPVVAMQTMGEVVARSVSDRRLYLWLVGSFALAALVLVVAGVYGTIAYAVAQRTREIGIRLALGSDPAAMQRRVVWQGGRLALLGVLIGLPAAFLFARLLEGQLFGVDRGDPATYAAVALVLGAVALAASYLPARRAARVDPVRTLRAE